MIAVGVGIDAQLAIPPDLRKKPRRPVNSDVCFYYTGSIDRRFPEGYCEVEP